MFKYFTAFLVSLFISFPVNAQIKLKIEDCVENVSPDGLGYCAWCCIESLGRYHKITSLYGLKEKRTKESDFVVWDEKNKKWIDEPYVLIDYGDRKLRVARNVGDYVAMKQKLDEAKVKYQIQETGIFKTDLIDYAIKNKLGCIIVIKYWDRSNVTHAVCIQDFDEDHLVLFNPNNLKVNYSVSWAWFKERWTGYVLVIEGVK